MARPFAPSDALRLRSQQALGTALELEAQVLQNESPLRQALAACIPFSYGGVDTFVQDASESATLGGFVQTRRRLDGMEADLVFISPALDGGNGAALTCQRLISDACQDLAARGCQRIYVTIGENDRYALQLLRQLGFVVHTSDTVFRRSGDLPRPPTPVGIATSGIDGPAAAAVETLAWQQTSWTERCRDGAIAGDWHRYPLGGRIPASTVGRVWLSEGGDVLGAWRLVRGRAGHWLCALASPQSDAGLLVTHALADDASTCVFAGLPIYAAARGHEPDLNLALRENGFEPVVGRFWLVKHTTVRVAEPAPRRSAWQTAGLDVAPTASCNGFGRSASRS